MEILRKGEYFYWGINMGRRILIRQIRIFFLEFGIFFEGEAFSFCVVFLFCRFGIWQEFNQDIFEMEMWKWF
jgi:hypothetical protein